jgi:UDP-N-acetylmuramyl pentapeptide phosphotransferase/UDP-N-acetylglucosamine-1-phosphate transferase
MLVLAALGSGLLCVLLILALRPLLLRYALARPTARSSHRVPTPQGGGIAVLAASLATALALAAASSGIPATLLAAVGGSVALAVLGAVDDVRPLPAGPRLLVQVAAVALVVAAADVRVAPEMVPLWVERALLVLAGTWFVNLVNFMDGLDWITVAAMVPITAFAALFAAAGIMPQADGLVAAGLCGALLGFAPFNRPVAKLFLGDVGSLPLGLLSGWLLLEIAGTGAIAAALLLPLYYITDASVTLLRRLARGERIWEAHRCHFYQQATDNGFSALAVSGMVFGLNLALAALAALTLSYPVAPVQAVALAIGGALVVLVLRSFARPREARLAGGGRR